MGPAPAGLLLIALCSSSPIDAQAPHDGRAREVSGVVSIGEARGERPAEGAWVTLHRVGTDRAGALDSMRTTAGGLYRFRYQAVGDTNALYFVSSRHAGIAYFSAPLRGALVPEGAGDLLLFDTTSGPVPIHLRGRHMVFMTPGGDRTRTVVEAFQLSNDSSITRVARGSEPVFSALLPDGATDVQAREGDLAPESVVFAQGRLGVFAPVPPGVKQFSVTYHLPATALVTVPGSAAVSALEVLTEGDATTASGAGLTEGKATALNGRQFRRFLAQDVPANSVFTLSSQAPAATLNPRIAFIVIGVGATLLLALARSFGWRANSARARPSHNDDPDTLDVELGALDAAFANLAEPTAAQRADHYQARAHLTARRARALARREALP